MMPCMSPFAPVLALAVLAGSMAVAAPVADRITPKTFQPPARTEWAPAGCRSVPFEHPVLAPRTAFRRAHANLESSDEVEVAQAPVFARAWVAEPGLYHVTTPAFDGDGNLYLTPLRPHEPVLLLSLEPQRGERRFAIPLEPGMRGGSCAPMVLRDPESGGEVVYVNAYKRVVAVRTDGTPVWNVPTGLGDATAIDQSGLGLAWVPNADAIVALMADGSVVLLDRRTGMPLLPAPHQLPGEKTPSRAPDIAPELAAQVDELLAPLIAGRPGDTIVNLIDVLLGGGVEVANNLSVDPRTGRLWIAAGAPDAEDGSVDGISAFGALYRLDVVPTPSGWALDEVCHRSFSGGSASTPTLGRNGTRVYLGDDSGTLIAVNTADCGEAWTVALDGQIFGSVAVSSDNREIYAASAEGIFQVFDDDDHGRRGWTAALDLYDVPSDVSGFAGVNLLLASAGANGLLIQAGVGLRTPAAALPVRTGIAHVDRLTGRPRWFADGLEESLAAMSTGPDGTLYLSHSPLRRAFSVALGLTTAPLLGGVSKWQAQRQDLLARDAACAAADRAANALAHQAECPDAARADMVQVDALRAQLLTAAQQATGDGALRVATARRLRRVLGRLALPPSQPTAAAAAVYHRRAARMLGLACRILERETSPRRAQRSQTTEDTFP
jgi:PQQ-like domain